MARNIVRLLIQSKTVTRQVSLMQAAGCLCQTGCGILYPMGARGTEEQSVWGLLMGPEARRILRVGYAILKGRNKYRRLTVPSLDTSHVPCKFFRSGQCQAGKACPFSHSIDTTSVDTPCKYFAKVGRAPSLTTLGLEGMLKRLGKLQIRCKMCFGSYFAQRKESKSTPTTHRWATPIRR